MRNIFFLLFILSSGLPGIAQERSVHTILSEKIFMEHIAQDGVQLIDVRTPAEFENGHLENAFNIDFLNTEVFEEEVQKLDKTKPVYIYCRSGNRSGKAALQMEQLGFYQVYDLEGGYMNLEISEIDKS